MNLNEIRNKKNMTMLELSNKVGISESYYCNIENGVRRPSVKVAKKIGKTLGFNWTKFFEEKGVS